MEQTNNKTEKPLSYYRQEFARKDPEEMSARSGVRYEDGVFHTLYFSRPVSVSWPDMKMAYEDDPDAEVASYIQILLARLIIYSVAAPDTGKFLSYQEVPWGAHYFKAFKGRCIDRLAGTYGSRPEAFKEDAARIGAAGISGGNASVEAQIFPGLKIRATIWQGDDEFPAAAQILFSDNFLVAFTAEDMAAVGDLFINALKGRW